MIANKIKPKVKKVIDKFPTYVDIYRNSKNEFGEPGGKELIYENLKGFYHEGNTQINFSIADKGEVKRSNQKFLMVIYDEETVKIQENDYVRAPQRPGGGRGYCPQVCCCGISDICHQGYCTDTE